MPNCCVPHCSSTTNKDKISFHEFPVNKPLLALWLKAIGRKGFTPNYNSSSSRVCAKHFKEADYIPNRAIRKLKPGVVPSCFEGNPSCKVQYIEKQQQSKRKSEEEAGNSLAKVTKKDNSTDFSSLDLVDLSSTNQDKSTQTKLSSTYEDKSTQTKQEGSKYDKLCRENKRLRRSLRSREATITLLYNKINRLQRKVNYYKNNVCKSNVEEIEVQCDEGCSSIKMEFLLAQVKYYKKKTPRWSDTVIRECIILQSISPKAYRWISERKLLKLPSKSTLKRYTGPLSGDAGFTKLIQDRLTEEARNLRPEERFCSLVIDEMALKPQCIYDQKLDRVEPCINPVTKR